MSRFWPSSVSSWRLALCLVAGALVAALQALAPPIAHAEHTPGATYVTEPGFFVTTQESVTVSDDGTGITRFAVAGRFDGTYHTPEFGDAEVPCSVEREFEATYDPPLPITAGGGDSAIQHGFSDTHTAPDSSFRLTFSGYFVRVGAEPPYLYRDMVDGQYTVVFPAPPPPPGACYGFLGSFWGASLLVCCQPDSTSCEQAKQKVKEAKQKLQQADTPSEKERAEKKLKKAKKKKKKKKKKACG